MTGWNLKEPQRHNNPHHLATLSLRQLGGWKAEHHFKVPPSLDPRALLGMMVSDWILKRGETTGELEPVKAVTNPQ